LDGGLEEANYFIAIVSSSLVPGVHGMSSFVKMMLVFLLLVSSVSGAVIFQTVESNSTTGSIPFVTGGVQQSSGGSVNPSRTVTSLTCLFAPASNPSYDSLFAGKVAQHESMFGILSRHAVLEMITENPFVPSLTDVSRWTLDPDAEQVVLSRAVAAKLALGNAGDCSSSFGTASAVQGYKSYIRLRQVIPTDPAFPIDIPVCVQDVAFNLLRI
jgi:hypothetical protein